MDSPEDRPPGPQVDDREPAEVEGPHPEPLEWQVEERQEEDLEDAVVADDNGPRLVHLLGLVAGHRRPTGRPGVGRYAAACAASGGETFDELLERWTDAGLDLEKRFATRRPGLQRAAPPGREDVAPTSLDLGAMEAFPFALPDLEQPGKRSKRDRLPERIVGGHRRGDGRGRLGRPPERRMNDLERRADGDRQGRRGP